MSELIAFQFILIFSKASTGFGFNGRDNGTFGSVLSPFGFKVETDVGNLGIHQKFDPFWLLVVLGTCNLILDSWFDQ